MDRKLSFMNRRVFQKIKTNVSPSNKSTKGNHARNTAPRRSTFVARPKDAPPPVPKQKAKPHRIPIPTPETSQPQTASQPVPYPCLKDVAAVPRLPLQEYSEEEFQYLLDLEKTFIIRPDLMDQQTVSRSKRTTLVDWLNHVHRSLKLHTETFYLAVSLVDRYLQELCVPVKDLQVLGVSALYVASKYEEVYFPGVEEFVFITDHYCSRLDILKMERLLLTTQNFRLSRPLPITFLRRLTAVANVSALRHNLAGYFLEIALQYSTLSHLRPSLLAASATYLSFYLTDAGSWTPLMVTKSAYSEDEVEPVVKKMATVVSTADSCKRQAIRNKFSAKYLKVALFPELKKKIHMFLSDCP